MKKTYLCGLWKNVILLKTCIIAHLTGVCFSLTALSLLLHLYCYYTRAQEFMCGIF